MRKLAAFCLSLGRLPVTPVVWGLALLFSAWVLLDVLVLHVSSGLAHSTYDAMVRSRLFVAAPDPRIVIVDIDEASLARMGKEFGRWPWPRDTLATVLDHVEKQGPAALAWDIVFADRDVINPGGDAAFNAAAARSRHSHFSVVRLAPEADAASDITRAHLPALWAWPPRGNPHPPAGTDAGGRIAIIPPVLGAVAAAPLGYNNAYADADGVLRRYRYADPAGSGGELLQSLPLSVLRSLDPAAGAARVAAAARLEMADDELIAWRRKSASYPRVSFADVFAVAEGGRPLQPVPSFAGKVVVIGATAPSLHDRHPTPLSPVQPGVDTLATAIDNALNGHRLAELPRLAQAALAIGMCLGVAVWAQRRSVSSLEPALFLLPASLVAISYLSLHGSYFLDMHLAAGLALTFLIVLRGWNHLRRSYWCSPPPPSPRLAIWPWRRSEPWAHAALDRLIDAVQRHAPRCRVMVADANARWPGKLRWPELACYAAIVGPEEELRAAREQLSAALRKLARRGGDVVPAPGRSRSALAALALREWASIDEPSPLKEQPA